MPRDQLLSTDWKGRINSPLGSTSDPNAAPCLSNGHTDRGRTCGAIPGTSWPPNRSVHASSKPSSQPGCACAAAPRRLEIPAPLASGVLGLAALCIDGRLRPDRRDVGQVVRHVRETAAGGARVLPHLEGAVGQVQWLVRQPMGQGTRLGQDRPASALSRRSMPAGLPRSRRRRCPRSQARSTPRSDKPVATQRPHVPLPNQDRGVVLPAVVGLHQPPHHLDGLNPLLAHALDVQDARAGRSRRWGGMSVPSKPTRRGHGPGLPTTRRRTRHIPTGVLGLHRNRKQVPPMGNLLLGLA